ncbi:hypothetical protein PCL_11117 [Purpureocillium lilacinum]|uniref:Uncharacterized protein n=1 Tax=Purpureocillium lilacinum TaxID=33203 RepID=A0A2U3ED92_PURLI|nr:hypothetical protein PCL_11117 [Purpureocillium lilacinum]
MPAAIHATAHLGAHLDDRERFGADLRAGGTRALVRGPLARLASLPAATAPPPPLYLQHLQRRRKRSSIHFRRHWPSRTFLAPAAWMGQAGAMPSNSQQGPAWKMEPRTLSNTIPVDASTSFSKGPGGKTPIAYFNLPWPFVRSPLWRGYEAVATTPMRRTSTLALEKQCLGRPSDICRKRDLLPLLCLEYLEPGVVDALHMQAVPLWLVRAAIARRLSRFARERRRRPIHHPHPPPLIASSTTTSVTACPPLTAGHHTFLPAATMSAPLTSPVRDAPELLRIRYLLWDACPEPELSPQSQGSIGWGSRTTMHAVTRANHRPSVQGQSVTAPAATDRRGVGGTQAHQPGSLGGGDRDFANFSLISLAGADGPNRNVPLTSSSPSPSSPRRGGLAAMQFDRSCVAEHDARSSCPALVARSLASMGAVAQPLTRYWSPTTSAAAFVASHSSHSPYLRICKVGLLERIVLRNRSGLERPSLVDLRAVPPASPMKPATYAVGYERDVEIALPLPDVLRAAVPCMNARLMRPRPAETDGWLGDDATAMTARGGKHRACPPLGVGTRAAAVQYVAWSATTAPTVREGRHSDFAAAHRPAPRDAGPQRNTPGAAPKMLVKGPCVTGASAGVDVPHIHHVVEWSEWPNTTPSGDDMTTRLTRCRRDGDVAQRPLSEISPLPRVWQIGDESHI